MLKGQIGYPTSPNTTDAASIRRYHALQEPFDPTDYFGNVQRSRMAVLRRKWNNVGGKRDLGTFDMTPKSVRAVRVCTDLAQRSERVLRPAVEHDQLCAAMILASLTSQSLLATCRHRMLAHAKLGSRHSYFDADWPEYLAFGAFGSVGAGHELSVRQSL